jgi:hypothetical protein
MVSDPLSLRDAPASFPQALPALRCLSASNNHSLPRLALAHPRLLALRLTHFHALDKGWDLDLPRLEAVGAPRPPFPLSLPVAGHRLVAGFIHRRVVVACVPSPSPASPATPAAPPLLLCTGPTSGQTRKTGAGLGQTRPKQLPKRGGTWTCPA